MAFVYRNQKQKKTSSSPGPGAYDNSIALQNKKTYAVSFNDKQRRQLWEVKNNPGPGDYVLPNTFDKNNIIHNDENQNLMVIESQQSSAFFKSKSKRCTYQQTSLTPGPGNYELNAEQKMICCQKVNKPTKLMKYLYQQNIKKAVPSIPEEYSWRDQQESIHKSEKKKKQKQKKSFVFASKVSRANGQRPKTSVGPGSYNFGSTFDKKTQISGKISVYISTKKRDVNDKIKENKNSQLGPGCYDVKTEICSKNLNSYSKGIPCFGSKQARFYSPLTYSNPNIGPATYYDEEKQLIDFKYDPKNEKKKPFISGSKKKFTLALNQNSNVSPFSYSPKKYVKKNYNKSKLSHFGSNAARFVEKKQQQRSDKEEQIRKEDQKMKEAIQRYEKMRNKCKKNPENQKIDKNKTEEDLRPLCYDPEYKTITKDHHYKGQINAPFYACEQRFSSAKYQKNIIEELQEMGKIKIENKKKSKGKNMKRKSHSSSVLKLYACELKKKQQENKQNELSINMKPLKENIQISPHSYNPGPHMKKSYNKLFADTILI